MKPNLILRQLRRAAGSRPQHLRQGPLSAAGAAAAVAVLGAAGATPLQVQRRWAAAGSKNPYTVLGLKEGADKQAIKKAYRVLARKHHPDAPGGSNERFQEIQAAYEQIKSGVWIRKNEGGGDDGGEGGEGAKQNRYAGFRYTTRSHSSKVTYDQYYTEMHTGKTKKDPFGDDEEDEAEAAARKDPRRNPFAMNEIAFQAWVRFIVVWCVVFVTLRVTLFLLFPPQWQRPKRAPPPRDLRKKPPPPKPLAHPGAEDRV